MIIMDQITRAAFRKGHLIEKIANKKDIQKFINRFKENYISTNLIRVGGDDDGGYLLPNQLDGIKYCFSPGVGRNSTFEKIISEKYGIKSFMADASVASAPIEDVNFEFDKKYLGDRDHEEFITLKSWINSRLPETERGLLLQMDIEGSEYDVLIESSSETLEKFSCMVIEFHGLEKMFNRSFLAMLGSVFEKIYSRFYIAHVHPNNCCGIVKRKSIEVPRVMEVTFIARELVGDITKVEKVSLPHMLDRKNIAKNEDLIMPQLWWK